MSERAFWKVCRKLANEERIDVLRKVMCSREEEGLSVGQIADTVRIGQPATSTYLAELKDVCGLVDCTRAGRYCLYRASPDSSNEKTVKIFHALRKFFSEESYGWASVNGARPPAPPFLSVLPALANEKRVCLVGFIRLKRRTDQKEIVSATGSSEINVRRHLACLATCGLVDMDGDRVLWHEPDDPISCTFIELSLA